MLPGATYHVFNRTNNRELLFKEEKNYAYFLERLYHFVHPWADVMAYCLMPNHFHLLIKVREYKLETSGISAGKTSNETSEIFQISDVFETSDEISEIWKISEIFGAANTAANNQRIAGMTQTGSDIFRLVASMEEEVLQKLDVAAAAGLLQKIGLLKDICREAEVFQALTPLEKAFKDFFISYTKSINQAYRRKGSLFQPKYKRKAVDNDWYLWRLIWYIHNNPVKAGLCANCGGWRWSSFNALMSDKPTRLCRDKVLAFFGGKAAFAETHGQSLPPEDWIKLQQFLDLG